VKACEPARGASCATSGDTRKKRALGVSPKAELSGKSVVKMNEGGIWKAKKAGGHTAHKNRCQHQRRVAKKETRQRKKTKKERSSDGRKGEGSRHWPEGPHGPYSSAQKKRSFSLRHSDSKLSGKKDHFWRRRRSYQQSNCMMERRPSRLGKQKKKKGTGHCRSTAIRKTTKADCCRIQNLEERDKGSDACVGVSQMFAAVLAGESVRSRARLARWGD